MDSRRVIKQGESTPPEVLAMFANFAAKEPDPSRKPRIALGLTLMRQVDAKASLQWLTLLRAHWWPGPIFHARNAYVVQARNEVLRQAFLDEGSWDGLLFWDADQVPPVIVPGPLAWKASTGETWPGGIFTEYLQWLYENEPGKGVIGGLYPSREDLWELDKGGRVRQGPHEPIAYKRVDKGYRHLSLEEMVPMLQRPALYRVDAVGTGSMLIRKETLLRLRDTKKPAPIFEAPVLGAQAPQVELDALKVAIEQANAGPAKATLRHLLERLLGHLGGEFGGLQWTEDIRFCHEVVELLGEEIWLDSAVQSAHIADKWIIMKDYLEARGLGTQAHEQSPVAVSHAQENERRKSRIIVPGRA